MFLKICSSKSALISLVLLFAGLAANAQPKEPSTLSNPLAQAMLVIMVLLAIVIAILGNVVNSAVGLFREKLRKDREAVQKASTSSLLPLIALIIGGALISLTGLAQTAPDVAAAPVVNQNINGLSPLTFYLLVSIIAIEIAIIIALVYQLKFLVGIESKRVQELSAATAQVPAQPKENWWWKINNAAPKELEQDIDLSHDYDGISELDNKLPPWWTVAFALTILFSVVYLYRYHVAMAAPLQEEELVIALKKAEVEKAAYLAKSANNVDETTVKMLDADGIAAGKTLFGANCIACHGTAGEGNTVGPNLTDDYWIHGGTISDVFKSLKYGWVEKGMRSWKDDFSPVQIAQLASYVKSLKGSKPANGKEPQGTLFDESLQTTTTDSTQATTMR